MINYLLFIISCVLLWGCAANALTITTPSNESYLNAVLEYRDNYQRNWTPEPCANLDTVNPKDCDAMAYYVNAFETDTNNMSGEVWVSENGGLGG